METKYIDEINTIEKLIDRSKDTNVIYLTEDTILNTKAVQKIANRLEQLEKENKFWKEYKEKLDKLDTKDFIFKHELENYIPKSVIREKFEIANTTAERSKLWYANSTDRKNWECFGFGVDMGRADALKELLGEE